jgi:Tfp pilus assembly protein PilV
MEAMIAIVIMGIGLFGIARLNSVMLAGTAIGKTRAEATQLAEGKLEEIRARQPPATKPVSSTSPETLTGVNATFSRSWTIAGAGLTGLDLDRVTVCVSWGDTCGGTGGRKVEIDSLLAWTNIATSGSVGSGPGGAE